MAAYTRLSPEDIEEILGLYGLSPLKEVEPLSLGISNSNYRCSLENGSKVILKVSNDKDKEDLEEEQGILQELRDFPLSLTPFQTRQGESVYHWKELNGVVFPFVTGAKPMGNDNEVFQLGEALSSLHLFSLERELGRKPVRSHTKVGFELEGILNYCQQQNALEEFHSACSQLLGPEEVKLWQESSLPTGLIHGDLYLDNTLFEEGKLQTLLDFEQSGLGAFIQDIGIAISGSCLDKDGVSHEKIKAFIQGYESQRQLESAEKELLNFAVALGFLDISLWRIKRFYDGNLDPQKKNSYKELLNLALDFKCKIRK